MQFASNALNQEVKEMPDKAKSSPQPGCDLSVILPLLCPPESLAASAHRQRHLISPPAESGLQLQHSTLLLLQCEPQSGSQGAVPAPTC